mmetsp:Transcript_61292/g.114630  ORF Transcript_61292/g.114630 Transcript_61292/m.114630 type:complete len:100 (+) Transcript_61292:245-544(+)
MPSSIPPEHSDCWDAADFQNTDEKFVPGINHSSSTLEPAGNAVLNISNLLGIHLWRSIQFWRNELSPIRPKRFDGVVVRLSKIRKHTGTTKSFDACGMR